MREGWRWLEMDGRGGRIGEKNERSLISTGYSAWMTGAAVGTGTVGALSVSHALLLPFVLSHVLPHARVPTRQAPPEQALPACQERRAGIGIRATNSI